MHKTPPKSSMSRRIVLALIGALLVTIFTPAMASAETSPWHYINLKGAGSYWYELEARLTSRDYGADGVQATHVKFRPAHSGCGWFEKPPYTDIDITAVRVSDGYHLATKHYNSWGCRQERRLPAGFRTRSPQGMVVYMRVENVRVRDGDDYHHGRTNWRLWQH